MRRWHPSTILLVFLVGVLPYLTHSLRAGVTITPGSPHGTSGTVILGSGGAAGTVGGTICKGAPAVATTGTAEEILATCTIPANTLSANGSAIRYYYFAHTAANGNNKVVRVRVGGIGGTLIADTGNFAANNQNITGYTGFLQRLSATTATNWITMSATPDSASTDSTIGQQAAVRGASITWANAQDFVITGLTATAAGDLTLDTFWVGVVQ